MENVKTSGCYIVTNESKKYLVCVSGNCPFLKIEVVWDCYHNVQVTDDVFRSKGFIWKNMDKFIF